MTKYHIQNYRLFETELNTLYKKQTTFVVLMQIYANFFAAFIFYTS